MVNILRKYRFLFSFTAAPVSFLLVMSVYAAPNSFKKNCDDSESVYICGDGKKHTIRNKTYHLKNSWRVSSDSAPIAALYIEGQGTVVNASEITVTGDNSGQGNVYGAYLKGGAHLDLKNANFKDVLALHAQNSVVRMTDGSITGTSLVMDAFGIETDVALVRINIETKPSQLNSTQEIGLVSSFGSKIRMSGSTVTFNEIGAFSAQFGGQYTFDNTVIKGIGKRETVIEDEKNIDKLLGAFEVFQGSNVQLRNSPVELIGMHGFLIKNFTGYADDNGKLINKFNSSYEFKKTNIKIENTDISIKGKGARGLYFYGLDPNAWVDLLEDYITPSTFSEAQQVVMGEAFVYLSETNFTVPDGIAIYSAGDDVYGAQAIVNLENTKISGDLLLKAENDSYLLVEANSSTLTGDSRVEDTSDIYLNLKRGSKWLLTKSKYKGSQEADATVSSLSGISLEDSTIAFDHYQSSGYQTLHIGKESDINQVMLDDEEYVYGADGNTQIKLGTFLNKNGLFDPEKTDRILIYGNVWGTTLLVMENFSKTSGEEVGNKESQSISLVQVAGTAEENSFKLINNYITINGFPYQYHLRAYGPTSSWGQSQLENRLVAGSGDFWDFRLEGVYIDPKSNSSESKSTSVSSLDSPFLPSLPESGIVPSEPPVEPISPPSSLAEQSPSVDSVPVASTPSLLEVSESFETSAPTNSISTVSTAVETGTSGAEASTPIVSPSMDSAPVVPVPADPRDSSSVQPVPAPLVPTETSAEVPPFEPIDSVIPPSKDSVSASSSIEPLPVPSSTPSLSEVLEPSDLIASLSPISIEPKSSSVIPSASVDSPPTDSTLSESIPPDPKNPSSAQSVPFVPTKMPTEVLPSEPSVLVNTLSKDSLPAPSLPVPSSDSPDPTASLSLTSIEKKPSSVVPSALVDSLPTDSTLSASIPPDPKNPSSAQSVPFVPTKTPTEVLPSEPSVLVNTLSKDSLPASSLPVPSSEPSDPTASFSLTSIEPKSSEPFKPVDSLPEVSVQPDIQPKSQVRAIVPQLPTYLLLPNALFQAGLMDLTIQNKKLKIMRRVAGSLLKNDEISPFFVRGYGGNYHYASNLSALEYGYGADLDYTALEAGIFLKEIESLYSHTLFGVMGTYGSLSLYPQDVEYSKKSPFDKWSVAAYGNMQHDTDFYVNGVFSYGLFKGDVFTLIRDKTATLKGRQLNTSLTSGKTFIAGHKSIIFNPQIQLLYQRLQFNRVHDVDNIDVDLGKFDQWTARFGGCLSKFFLLLRKGVLFLSIVSSIFPIILERERLCLLKKIFN
ncbi:autotransporter outer membrane beta-barrel domain-containing protein [Bartonella birtlesii]|uniref:autotransporter outer membrane beta-barrel domain-containing protein n=1 Tax=Bartonella birtlesii TaxID=111504 RepID=UPI00040FC20C|nr:autotransporter outer membrane beta-barrel domain-containing protein [Bartonella birtlesii]